MSIYANGGADTELLKLMPMTSVLTEKGRTMSKELTIMCIAFCATMLMQELRIRTLKKQIEIEKSGRNIGVKRGVRKGSTNE